MTANISPRIRGLLTAAVVAVAIAGCGRVSPHLLRHRIDEFQEGVCLECGHNRTIDDDFQRRAELAGMHAAALAECTRCDFVLLGQELKKAGHAAKCPHCDIHLIMRTQPCGCTSGCDACTPGGCDR